MYDTHQKCIVDREGYKMQDFRPTVTPALNGGYKQENLPQVSLSADKLKELLTKFTTFIDATPRTAKTYKTNLKQFFIYLEQTAETRPTMETIRDYRQALLDAGKRPTTVQSYLIAVKQFFKFTEATGLYPNVAKYVKGARINHDFKKSYLSESQCKQILSSIDTSSIEGKRNHAMLLLMLTTGLRTIEVSRADVKDIQPSGKNTVLKVWGKGHADKDAKVRLPESVERVLRDYLKDRHAKPAEPLFTSTANRNRGQRITSNSVSRIVKTIFRNAGYDDPMLTAHSTRHTTATLSLLNGATLQQTQMLLRHKSPATTEIYADNIRDAENPASEDVASAILG